jgi:hypothetical protein
MRINELHQLDTLVRGGLWFSRIDTFKDCLEGTLPNRNVGLLEKLLPEQMSEEALREYRFSAKRDYATCWTMSDSDPSKEMWEAQFGNRGKGIAVRSTSAALIEATRSIRGEDGPVYLGRVRYINHEVDLIPEAQTLEACFVVKEEFRYQNEVRLLIHSYGHNAATILASTKSFWGEALVRRVEKEQSETAVTEFVGFVPENAPGKAREHDGQAIVLPVDPSQVVQEVLLGWRLDSTEVQKVYSVLQEARMEHLMRQIEKP